MQTLKFDRWQADWSKDNIDYSPIVLSGESVYRHMHNAPTKELLEIISF